MSGGIKMTHWRGDELVNLVKTEMEKRLAVAAEVVRAEAVKSIKTPYPPASTPGHPPHSRSGASGLLGSVFYRVESDKRRAIIGTPLKYGLYLEMGTSKMKPRTSKMKPRPFLRPALTKSLLKVKAILTRPLPMR